MHYILFGFTVAATVGPITITVIKTGLKKGFLPSLLVSLGAITVDAFYLLLIFFGVSSFLQHPVIKIILGSIGVIFLLYLGIQSIRDFFSSHLHLAISKKLSIENPFLTGITINLGNPLGPVFWLGFFGMVSSSLKNNAEILLAILGVVTGCSLWLLIISIIAYVGRKVLHEEIVRYIAGIAGLVLIGFAGYMGYGLFSIL